MGILSRPTKNNSNTQSSSNAEELSLSKLDIELLLNMIRTNTFVGEHVEPLYNLIVKLQKQYINIKD